MTAVRGDVYEYYMRLQPKIELLPPALDLRGHWQSFTDYLIPESQHV